MFDILYHSMFMNPNLLKQIELISQNGKISEQMRIMLSEWLNLNYPDQDVIDQKIQSLQSELVKLEQFKNDIITVTERNTEESTNLTIFRDKMIDSVMNMISIQFIYKSGDDEYHKKWMNTLKFNKKTELIHYLEEIYNKCGIAGVLKHIHRNEFIKFRKNDLELKARLEQSEFDEYLLKHNIDLYKEYDDALIKGSSKDFEEYKQHVLNK